MRFQRILQGMSFLSFLILLSLAASPVAERMRVDLFLRMDPLALLAVLISGRVFIFLLVPALVIIVLTLLLGRFFCSTLCPLGTTIDIIDRVLRAPRKRYGSKESGQGLGSLKIIKYLFLSFILGASLAGVSLVFLGSPLSLATRIYGLVVYPAFTQLTSLVVFGIREAGHALGVSIFEYTRVPTPTFVFPWVTLATGLLVLGLGLISRRFWCRYLCPAGAVLAMLSTKPLVRRAVSDSCTGCGICRKTCPMGAIGDDPVCTQFSDCIVCERCARGCPTGAVRFAAVRVKTGRCGSTFSKHRRGFIVSGLCGLGAALVSLNLARQLRLGGRAGQGTDFSLIRPPGALPESGFLSRCIRCGECMKACPTNTLQPLGFSLGMTGLMSPVIAPRRGPCEPSCTRCGSVCPTGALRALTPAEKIWAKVGTAMVIRERCIAWESGKECLVCDEVCPFGAVDLKRTRESRTPVPFVKERQCNGCGFCEHACPVPGDSAIVVESRGAFRMEKGSYIRKGRAAGYVFEVKQPSSYREEGSPENGIGTLPPGFEE